MHLEKIFEGCADASSLWCESINSGGAMLSEPSNRGWSESVIEKSKNLFDAIPMVIGATIRFHCCKPGAHGFTFAS